LGGKKERGMVAMVFIGLLIVVATGYCIIKRYDARMVLFAAGLIMALISLEPLSALNAFSERMVNSGLLKPILSVTAFAFVMKETKCDLHLIHSVVNVLKKTRSILIPASVIAVFAINIALPSAAGIGAAVGVILVPVLMAAGIQPTMAAAAVLGGTFGSMLNPGLAHNPMVAEIAGVDVIEVIATHSPATILAGLILAIGLTVIALLLKEDRGYVYVIERPAEFKVSIIKAIVPVIPLAILVLGATKIVVALNSIDVPGAMIIGAIIGMVVTKTHPQKVVAAFYEGMGNAYTNVMSTVISAAVFVAGLTAIGLVDALINLMLNSQAIVKFAGSFGPLLLGCISGSGDSAAFAFNEAVTPHAMDFGLNIIGLGSLAALTGALGRTMSPVAAVTTIVSGIAGVSPIEVVKRTGPGVIVATIVAMFILAA
jgi:DcuC family C4-dicarboxylate transporter